ncbi:TPA: GntR family transcriptional regulator [Burkholderia cepacia ATCC 25416]|uniref:GntR family transcriptional regulator n=1 Tax=Burkholderia cepacia TaxID=292 RepID=UPI00075C7131|nr:GntR family transcriptional regulator [Burkholderia cepacia]HDR9768175.1 GntR family transcriptional regulator [Burkholderia cepacia ATCC 25416]KWC93900.1 GntR family transcriptional regulator [Burkholderia cepacia]MCA8028050.1 GntR family transcriptional regulator [Burkholderia cepacia]MCA8076109.1 GntR family transcriptional regulator [Burkholderia cepacia]RRA22271.1 GntR family transcriptional regulator [Burkholderia cepacia]
MTSPNVVPLSAAPLYVQIKDTLRARILDGTYAPHSRMPSEHELCAAFGVSRITVRQALGDLQKEGLLFKLHGKGTFVSKPKAFQNVTSLQGFAEAMSSMGYEIVNQVRSVRTVKADRHLATKLNVPEGAPLVEIHRVRLLNREPVSLEQTWVPEALGKRLAGTDLATRDIFLVLENDCGIPLGHADVSIDAILADDEIVDALQVEESSPVLRIERLTHDASGAPIDYEYLYFRGDAFQYRLRIDRQKPRKPARKQR